MKRKLAIIGAAEFQMPLIEKAKEKGYETHVFAWEEGAVGKDAADFFYPISITEKEQILDVCREEGIDGIVSIGSDLAVITVNYVSEKLGLNGNAIASSLKCTNKYAMRGALREAGIPVPHFQKVKCFEDLKVEDFRFPVIVKPTDRSGSRSITELQSPEGLEDAIMRAVSVSFEKCAIVEEFIAGNEYSCEGISYRGEHHILALTKKYTTGAPNFIETGHMEPSDIGPDDQKKVMELIPKALDALGIMNSASHAEFRIDESGRIGIIEIGARMGGDCIGSDLVYLSTGYDFVGMVIDVACGIAPDFTRKCRPRVARIRFLFDDQDIKGLEESRQKLDIWRESAIAYENLGNVTDSSSRLGFYIWREEEL